MVFRLFSFSACNPAKTEVSYDTTERRDWIGKRFCIVPAHGHPHSPPFRAEKSPSAFDRCVGICYNKSTKGILPIDGQPKLKTLTRM